MRTISLPKIRFSLRTFLLICILPIPLLTWIGNAKYKAVRQRNAIAHFQSRGCDIGFDSDEILITTSWRAFCDKVDPDIARRVTYLSGPALEPGDIEQLDRLQGLRDLHLGYTLPIAYTYSDDTVRKILSIKSLASVTLDAKKIDPRSLEGLAHLPELHSVALPNVKFDAPLLDVLAKKSKIAFLQFDGSGLKSNDLAKLAKLPLLQSLVIHHAAPGTLSALRDCEALTNLGLYDCHLTAEDGKAIQSLRIRTLDLVDATMEQGFFRNLELHRSITRVSVQKRAEFYSTTAPADSMQLIRLAEWRYCEDHFTEPKSSSRLKASTTP
jgi:hypothetical protein